MTKLQMLEEEIKKLSPKELAELREWFLEREAEEWDREIQEDVAAGKLDKFAAEALEEFKRGKTKQI